MSFLFIKILILFKLCIYLVLNNAHNATFSINVWMQNQICESMANFFILNKGDLGNEFQVLHIWMVEEVMAILPLFFSFVSLYFVYKADNMITLVLKLQFKLPLMRSKLWCARSLIWWSNIITKHSSHYLWLHFVSWILKLLAQKLNL